MNDALSVPPVRRVHFCLRGDRQQAGLTAAQQLAEHRIDAEMGARWRGEVHVRRVFHLPADELDALIARAQETTPGYDGERLHRWMALDVSEGIDPESVAQALRGDDLVERADVLPVPRLLGVNYMQNPDWTEQTYYQAAPVGINAIAGWALPGGDGAGITVADHEYSWIIAGPDLQQLNFPIIGTTVGSVEDAVHGSEVLAILAAADNTVDGVGIVPNANFVGYCVYTTIGGQLTWDSPNQILLAAQNLAFGDVFEILYGFVTSNPDIAAIPAETDCPTGDAIALLCGVGVIVLEGAGDAPTDLDTYTNGANQQVLNPSSPDFFDSGAILVGGSDANRARWLDPPSEGTGSPYGARINSYSTATGVYDLLWNNGVYAGAGPNNFSGTSAATPIVAGAVAAIQGISRTQTGYRLSPAQMRYFINETGTPSANPTTDLIGTQPDIQGMLTELGLLPSLLIRDTVGDIGEPVTGTKCASPDIIPRQQTVADPQTEWGQGSGNENNASLGENLVSGQPGYVYLRARNIGGATATNVVGHVYYAPPSTLASPQLWQDHIGDVTFPDIPPGQNLTVSSAVEWSNPPLPGHFCLVATVGGDDDPAPVQSSFTTWDQFVAYVDNNSTVAWHNLNILAAAGGMIRHPVVIAGAWDSERIFDITVTTELHSGATVQIEFPPTDGIGISPIARSLVRWERHDAVYSFHAPLRGRHELASLHIESGALLNATVRIDTPNPGGYVVTLAQHEGGRQLGAITWDITAR